MRNMENQYFNQNHDDKELTDKGWDAMRALLDRELPEEPAHRRRPVWWWWLGGLLLLPLVAGAGWLLLGQDTPVASDQAAPTPRVEPPVRNEPATPIAVHPATPAAVEPAPATQPAPLEAAGDRVERQHAAGHRVATTLPAPVRAGAPAPAVTIETTPQPVPAGAQAATSSTATETAAAGTSATAIETVAAPPVSRPAPLAMLPGITTGEVQPTAVRAEAALAYVPTVQPLPAAGENTIKPSRQPSSWAFGVAGGVTSQALPRVNGAVAGLTVDFQAGRRWGLRTGLAYRFQYAGAGNRVLAQVSEDSYALVTGNYNVVANNSNFGMIDTNSLFPSTVPVDEPGFVLVPVKDQHHLELPLSLYWQPLAPLRLYGGIGLSYLLYGRTSSQAYAEDINDVVMLDVTQENATAEVNSLALNTLPRWQADARFGLGWRFGRRAELNLTYQLPITGFNLFSNQADSAFDPQARSDNFQTLTAEDNAARPWLALSGLFFF
jgi:hypothetical protein